MWCIDGLQPIPRESNDKDAAAMLDELTIEANVKSFAIVPQRRNMKTIYTRFCVCPFQLRVYIDL